MGMNRCRHSRAVQAVDLRIFILEVTRSDTDKRMFMVYLE